MFTCVITEKGGSQKRLTFTEPEVTIGRVPGNDVVLPKGNVSKRHSRIVLKDNRFIVVDLKSTNGTYVNGRKITSPLVVKEGDKIYIGDFILTLEGDAALTAPADAMKPPSAHPPEQGSLPGSMPPPLPSKAPDPMAEDIPAVLRGGSTPPSSPPSGSSSTSVGIQAPSIPPVIAASEPEEHTRSGPETTNVVQFPSEEHTASEALHISQQALAVGAPSMRNVSPLITAKSVLPPHMRDDLRSLMTRLGREFDIDNADPSAVGDEKRWQKAERAIQGKLGELTSDGTIPRTVDKATLAKVALHEAVGLGPLDALLSDADIRQVVVERFDRVRADRGKGLVLEQASFSSPQGLITIARRLLAQGGVEGSAPITVDLALPSGLQLVVVMPNAASEGPVLSLRRRPSQVPVLAETYGSHAESLKEALEQGKHLWVVGAASVDPSELVSALLGVCAENERVALFERAPDIALGARGAVCFKLGVVSLAELLERVRYFRPDRLVLHELRDADLAAAISDLSQRHDGSIVSSEHGSAEQLVSALEKHTQSGLAARAVHTIVELAREGEGVKIAQLRHLETTASGKLALKA